MAAMRIINLLGGLSARVFRLIGDSNNVLVPHFAIMVFGRISSGLWNSQVRGF